MPHPTFRNVRNLVGSSENDDVRSVVDNIDDISLTGKGWSPKAKVQKWAPSAFEITPRIKITSQYRLLNAFCQALHADLKNAPSKIKVFLNFGKTANLFNLVKKTLKGLDESSTLLNLPKAYGDFIHEMIPIAQALKEQSDKSSDISGKAYHMSEFRDEGEILLELCEKLKKLDASTMRKSKKNEENDEKSKKGKHKFWNKSKKKNKENDEDNMDDNEDDDNENEDDDEDDDDGPGGKGKAKRGIKGKSKNENDNDDDDDDEDEENNEDDDEDEKDKSKKIGKDKEKDKKDDDDDLDVPKSKDSGGELHDEKVDSTATPNKLGATSSGESPHVDVNSDNSSETDDLNKDSADNQSIGSPMQNTAQEGNIPSGTDASGNLGINPPQASLPNQQSNYGTQEYFSSNNGQQQTGTVQNQQQNMNGNNQFAGQSYSGPNAAPNNSLGSRPMRLGPELFGNNDGNNHYQEPNNTYAYGENGQNSNNNQSPNNGYQQQNAGYSYNNGQNQNNNSYQYQNSSPYVYGSNQNANNAQFVNQSYSGQSTDVNNSLGSRPMRLGPELFGINDGTNHYQEPNNNTYAYGGNGQNSNNNQSPNNGYQQQNAGYSYNNGQNQNNNNYQYQNSSPYTYGSNQNTNNAQFVNQSYSGQNTNVNNSLGSRPMRLGPELFGNNDGNNQYQEPNNTYAYGGNGQNSNNNQFQNNGYQDPNVGAPYYNNDQGQNNNGYQWENSNFNSHYNGQNPDFDSKNMSSESDDDAGFYKNETFDR